ncbi:MAG: hypothetical protein WAM60_04275, partial [Candidatus Promineifilaceae bacterium]
HYAAARYLWPKSVDSPRRICFFGESVAAGYLYAPHVTPAKVLAAQLDFVVGPDAYEVIDLARTNETLAGLVETVDSAMQLEPDMLVIFGGNNWNLLETPEWSPYLPGVTGRMAYAEQLKRGGLEAVIEAAAKERLQKAWMALGEIGVISRNAAVPVILVIPEVNLADWENCQPVHWLDGEGLQAWYGRLEEAQKALAQQDWERAASLARQMLDLDGGLNPTPYRLLVRANVGLGKLDVARKAAEAEIGSSHYAVMAFLAAPQAGPADQALLRRAAAFNGFTPVDLPEFFGRQAGSMLPGRNFFLDYCHLTVEGMEWAMGEVTAAVLRQTDDGQAYPLLEMLDGVSVSGVESEALATAHLGAAIHNAHRLCPVTDKQEILVHWCLAALADSPAINQAMIDFVAARALPYPAVMTAEQQRLYHSPYLLQHQHGWKYDHLDAEMIQAILTALKEWEPRWAEAALTRLVENAALGRKVVSLLDGRYDAEPLRRLFPEVIPTPDLTGWAIYRAFWPVTGFSFVMADSADVAFDITARLPNPAENDARIALLVNGKRVGEMAVGRSWLRHEGVIDGRYIRRGLNDLVVRWPYPIVKQEEVWEQIIGRLEKGQEANLHPVFGELERLRIQKIAVE